MTVTLYAFYETSNGFWRPDRSCSYTNLASEKDAVAEFENLGPRAGQGSVIVDGRLRLHGVRHPDGVTWRDAAEQRVTPEGSEVAPDHQ